MKQDMPARTRIYKNFIFDSERWDHFSPRAGDVIVCTSYKAGTTWTQMICALLIHQRADLPARLSDLSPWLDMRVEAIEDIIKNFEGQNHRRVIKTHTHLDGLPYYPEAHYVFCGREPRDVFMSLQNHLANADMDHAARLLAKQGVEFDPPPPLPDDVNDRFRLWLTAGSFEGEEDGVPYWSHFRHCQTFWQYRHMPNIHFLHYSDLKADLEGQMRKLASALDIMVAEEKWPELVEAATFTSMKKNADKTAPDTNHGMWHSNSAFFNKGQNAQWRGVLSEESMALYDGIIPARYDAAMLAWLEGGTLAAGEPV